ncbi:C4b-binding protein-like [Anoplophora glabripennis]|uniref:C4b-binding protein-like n=1 Tax=Anoplophora glabripennis TaxID=217634 RepID=UPI000C75E74A|nr:C4b-binding protein-like [Anoplophora glabripennis]
MCVPPFRGAGLSMEPAQSETGSSSEMLSLGRRLSNRVFTSGWATSDGTQVSIGAWSLSLSDAGGYRTGSSSEMILKSTFCNKCEEPKLLFNGKVKIIQNIAYYFCDAGYELNTNEYVKGRKCTKATKWEGFYEPYCKKKSCGYPGTVKNGYQIGNGYSFQDRIRYNCYNGFRMIGNSTIICGKDGIWFPKKPQCNLECSGTDAPKTLSFPPLTILRLI